ncbi:MAG: hypothetical protein NBV60_03040 [Erythrobacter sp.]|nr:hypothetical protein [Erythrobacter sp.]
MLKLPTTLPLAALALALPALANAQNYSDLPPLAPMSEAEVRSLPAEYRTAPATTRTVTETTETVIDANGVETITRTRRIDLPAAPQGYAPAYAPSYAPVVFERDQWLDECRRRTAGKDKDDTGAIIGGLLGAIAGGFAGYEIAGVGDRVLGTVLGVGGGGLIGGLLGSLFDGDDDADRYDCEAALDTYLSQYGTSAAYPGARSASREIPYPTYGYAYAPPQMVMVPVRSEVPQQVVVRETERYETYTVPGAARIIPAPRPSPKMIKGGN